MTAREFWKEKFEEYPQNDDEKLAVAMMAEYGILMYNQAIEDAAKSAVVKHYEIGDGTITAASVDKKSILRLKIYETRRN